jgi:glycine hydroxymethyltransferase
MKEALVKYFKETPENEIDTSLVAYMANLSTVAGTYPEIAKAIVQELKDQRSNIKLIASENYTSLSTQLAMGNLLTDKYAEGFPGHRFYAGCDNIDDVEARAVEEICRLFSSDHAYVQPHSGADANLVAYWAILNKYVQVPELEKMGEKNPAKLSREDWNKIKHLTNNQRLLGMDYYSGGHLTHGYRHNVSAQMFDVYSYSVTKESGVLDLDELGKQAREVKPLILLAGYSAYPRKINFAKMKEIAEGVGAVLMVDMAHFAGLVAGGVLKGDYDPVAHADIVTTTTHKTLRGPRGGVILCKEHMAEYVDKGCPMVLGGPLPHAIAAKAVAFREARSPEFGEYAHKIVGNAQALAQGLMDEGVRVATDGTDNHLLLADVTTFGLNGRQAEAAVRECGITLNRNALPFDPNGPWFTSGLRLGTPAVTTLGMGTDDMREIASIVKLVLENTKPAILKTGSNAGNPSKAKYEIDEAAKQEALDRVETLLRDYQVYPNLDIELLEASL